VNAEERTALVREVALAGNCSHPIRISGEMVNLATGEVGTNALRIACKDRRRVICPACSYTYKADAWILVSTGLMGGKGTPEAVGTHPRLFVTLTAPSFGRVHTITASGGCTTRRRSSQGTGGGVGRCQHGRLQSCARRHLLEDPQLGRPLCYECFDYESAVLWNAHVARLWHRTIQSIRRSLGEAGGVAQSKLKSLAQLHYLKVAEVQRRGLVHLHAIIRVDGPNDVDIDPPEWLTAEFLAHVIERAVKSTSIVGLHGESIHWGRVLDIRDLQSNPADISKVSSYVAKYATKTTDGSRELARRFHSRRQIEMLIDDPHARRLALSSWDLALRPELERLHLRHHAHTFGFTGQLITKSRQYSTTFAALRLARVTYMASHRNADPIAGTFHYDGRGYDDPRGTQLAELFFTMQRELRVEASEARRAGHLDTTVITS
jgi:hypothetical protein